MSDRTRVLFQMDRTMRIAGVGMNKNFVEDSPQNSVKPVASSTFMMSKTEFDFNDLDNTFPSLKQVSTSALSTTSSLGVIDLEKQSLLSEREDNESFRLSRTFVDEQRALSLSRFKERMNDISISKSSSDGNQQSEQSTRTISVSSPAKSNATYDIPTVSTKIFKSPSRPSLFDNVSNLSNVSSPLFDTSFNSGNMAVLKLEADQMENRKQFGSLPVSPVNISVDSENIEEREKQFAAFVKSKCYSPEEISNVLRNKLNIDSKENVPPDSISNATKHDQMTPFNTKNCTNPYSESKVGSQNSRIPVMSNEASKRDSNLKSALKSNDTKRLVTAEFQHNELPPTRVQMAVADSTFFNDTLEESRSSSIASINQIAAALRRKSLMAEPRLAIEHLLSIGKTKKYTPSVTPSTALKFDEIPRSSSSTSSTPMAAQCDTTPNPSECTSVNTPSTITCPARNFSIDSATGKVCASDPKLENSFVTARQLLEMRKSLDVSEYSAKKMMPKTSTTYFSLVRHSSLLDVIDDHNSQNHVREFWKLNPSLPNAPDRHDLLNVSLDSTTEKLDEYRKQIGHLIPNRLLRADMPNNSFKANGLREPVHRISLSHNVTDTLDSIEMDSSDADSCSEIINAGRLCVGTQVEVIVAIENPTAVTLNYKMTVQSICVDGYSNMSAASVMLVADYPSILLLPNVENEIKIMLSPLVHGKIEVILELVSEEKRFSNITREIKFIGDNPKLRMETPKNPSINFGPLVEGETKLIPLRLKNETATRLPLKLIIHEDNQTKEFAARAVVEPLDVFECHVRVTTMELSNDSPNSLTPKGQLLVLLDTSEEAALGAIMRLHTIDLSAQISRVNLLVGEVPLVLSCMPMLKSETGQLKVMNASVVPVEVTVKIQGPHVSEFDVEPSTLKLFPRNERFLKVTFKPSSNDRRREIELQFIVTGSSKIFFANVIGLLEVAAAPSALTPVKRSTETCTTPHSHSSSSSSSGADGPMELDCTHSSISWGSVQLHTKNIQTITLRNRNSQREKLLLSISDSSGAFKFVENEFYYRDLKMTLEPKESRKISVLFMPFVADQAMNGKILIMRRHSLEASIGELRKRVIPLYGMGGRIKISFTGVFRDNENRSWITPETDTFETKFTVENSGDSVAFVKFVSEDSDDILVPEEAILLPAESAEVNYVLHLNRDRMDLLHKQNPQKEILLVNKLTVFWGCESTRLRLKKLWTRFEEFENIQRIRDKVEILMDMSNNGKVNVDSLSDSPSMLNKLWYEGVVEQTIGVLISQQNLDSACLDSTVVFKDLVDHTTTS